MIFVITWRKPFEVMIVETAKIFMNEISPVDGSILGLTSIAMPQTIFSSNGTFLGHYDTTEETIVLDGVVFGCVKYSGYIKYRIAVSEPEPEVKPCPTNPNLPINDPKCKPCPTNPDLNFDDPKCKPVTNIPDTGIFEPALVSIISIIGLGIIMSATILYSTRHKNR